MINVTKPRCDFPGGCPKLPSYGFAFNRKARFCAAHTVGGMVNVTRKHCRFGGGCAKQPSYRVPGTKTAAFCAEHRPEGMMNVSHKKCAALAPPAGVVGDHPVSRTASTKARFWAVRAAPEGAPRSECWVAGDSFGRGGWGSGPWPSNRERAGAGGEVRAGDATSAATAAAAAAADADDAAAVAAAATAAAAAAAAAALLACCCTRCSSGAGAAAAAGAVYDAGAGAAQPNAISSLNVAALARSPTSNLGTSASMALLRVAGEPPGFGLALPAAGLAPWNLPLPPLPPTRFGSFRRRMKPRWRWLLPRASEARGGGTWI